MVQVANELCCLSGCSCNFNQDLPGLLDPALAIRAQKVLKGSKEKVGTAAEVGIEVRLQKALPAKPLIGCPTLLAVHLGSQTWRAELMHSSWCPCFVLASHRRSKNGTWRAPRAKAPRALVKNWIPRVMERYQRRSRTGGPDDQHLDDMIFGRFYNNYF